MAWLRESKRRSGGYQLCILVDLENTHHANIQLYSTRNPDWIRIPSLIVRCGDFIHVICTNYTSDTGYEAKAE